MSDLALTKLSSTVRAIVVGKCASLTAGGIVAALDTGKLASLARLAVVLGADYEHPSGMNWTKSDKQRVVDACERRGITWQTKWSCACLCAWPMLMPAGSEEELALALDNTVIVCLPSTAVDADSAVILC